MENRDSQGGAISRRPQDSLSRSRNGYPMTLSNPWHEMEEMHRQMDDLFDRVFGVRMPDFYGGRGQAAARAPEFQEAEPDVDIYENDSEYIIHAALPGIDPQNIQIEATENTIQLTAENNSPFGTNTQRQENSSGDVAQQTSAPHTQHRQSRYSSQRHFRFAYTLPNEIDTNGVQANFRNGRLEIHLPKLQQEINRSVRVPIQMNIENRTDSTQSYQGSQANFPQSGASSQATPQEGNPSAKMGGSYQPTGGEDHTSQTHAAVNRREAEEQSHQRREEKSGGTIDTANPMTNTQTAEKTPAS